MSVGVQVNSSGCVKVNGSGCVKIGPCTASAYQQARLCSDNSLTDVWMTTADAAMFPGAFTLMHGVLGYYFAGDTGTPGTIYTAADAQPFADCTAAVTCGSGSCTADGDFTLDTSGPWDLSAAGFTDYILGTLLSQPRPMTDLGSGCQYADNGTGLGTSSLPGPGGTKYYCNGFVINRRLFDGQGNPICDHFGIQASFVDIAGLAGSIQIFYLGTLINGAGSKVGRYYYWYDSTTTTFDANSFGTDGVMAGNCPAFFDIP